MTHGPSALLRLLTRFSSTYGPDKCYPGQAFLARRFEVETRTIRRWTEILVLQGKLACQSRGPRTMLYRVIAQHVRTRNVRSFVRSNVRSSVPQLYINPTGLNGEERMPLPSPVEKTDFEELERFAIARGLPLSCGADIDAALRMFERKPPQRETGEAWGVEGAPVGSSGHPEQRTLKSRAMEGGGR